MENYMYKTKWIVFNEKGEKIKVVTLKHKDGGLYKEIEPFEKELKEQGLYGQKAECFEQEHLKGKSFKEKLKWLGWEFSEKGIIL